MFHPNTQEVKESVKMLSWMNKELLTELRHPKEAHKWWQHRKVAEGENSSAVLSLPEQDEESQSSQERQQQRWIIQRGIEGYL